MKRSPSSPARAAMKGLCTLLGLVLAVMLSFTLMVQNTMKTYSYSHPSQVPYLSGDFSNVRMPELNLSKFFSSLNPKSIGGLGSGITNILLVCQDTQEEVLQAQTIVLCTYHSQRKDVTLTSFHRNLQVSIPGHGEQPLHAAFPLGGDDLLEQVLEETYDLHIDGCVDLQLSRFPEVIDQLGGVTLELQQEEADLLNQRFSGSLTEGSQSLTGEQAHFYSQLQLDTDDPFRPAMRQINLLKAMIEHFREMDLSKGKKLAEALQPMVDTNMSKAFLLSLALELLPNLSSLQVVSQQIPAEDSYTSKATDSGTVLEADPGAIQEMLRSTLIGND